MGSRHGVPPWIGAAAATRVDLDGNVSSVSENMFKDGKKDEAVNRPKAIADFNLSFGERVFSAAGAACLSAIIVNPLDVAKVHI